MPHFSSISSRENPIFRYAMSMHNRKRAQTEGLVFLEGVRLCEDALLSGCRPEIFFFTEDRETLISEWEERFSFFADCRAFILSDSLMAKLSQTKTSQGIAMLVPEPRYAGEYPKKGRDIYLIGEKISDPGNLGAMIRMADAFSFSAVFLTKGSVDPFNEKVIRASMGSCFHIPLFFSLETEEVIETMKRDKVQVIGTHLNGSSLDDAAVSFPCAYIVGNEATGMSDPAVSLCDVLIKIPMDGAAESLNASGAATVVGYVLSRNRRGR